MKNRFFYQIDLFYIIVFANKADFIGRFERLQEDVRKVADILGTSVGRVRKMGATSHAPYWTYYNDEAEENVRQYYAVDFERFGYDDRIRIRDTERGGGHARL